LSDRNAEFHSQQHARYISRSTDRIGAVDFFNLLTGPELLDMTDSLLPEHRERLYPPTLALSMFMGQVLSEDGSCQKAVDTWAAQRAVDGLNVQSVNTGAYCKARQRLPVEMVSTLTRYTAQQLSTRAQAGWRWRGRSVKLVDGTGILMPDTVANQAIYPQLSSQALGVGSPLARLRSIVFVHRNDLAEEVASNLAHHKLAVADLNAELSKMDRKRVMDGIRGGAIRIMIASDLAARGLNIPDVTHIFNLDVPTMSKAYLHRVGRTARRREGHGSVTGY
jgi:hypothetical protein